MQMRRMAMGMLFALVATGLGCRMCTDCYDYAGPVVAPGYGPTMGFQDRAGSIIQGYQGQYVPINAQGVEINQGTPHLAPPQPDPEPTLAPIPQRQAYMLPGMRR